ncbi:hypothetical protein C8J55DRAFT_601323 [Lentinula edodes]|uniref:Uncharacterized protein n=1 Tax=Lentinula lateritia TaxID=40482 RepID=A0A9W9E1C1_9AGAR|nr:hypothetical protein C8J55DRAFT_601323 [Lentinula edodes]
MSTRKKSQRKRIPAALHSELTEYSSLLRSLRTNDTLDVTSQLTRYFYHKGKAKSQTYDDDDSECINDGDEDFKDVGSDVEEEHAPDVEAGSSCRTNPSSKSSAKRKRASRPQSLATEDIMSTKTNPSTHETWTRWPLLAQDVPYPEWTLQDEVAHITAFLLRDTSLSPSDLDSDPNSSNSSLISTLTLSSSRYLDSILASLAAIIPKRSVSMINRLAPAGWQSVLAAAQLQAASQASGGSSTKRVLERVQKRLEDIYGSPSRPRTIVASSSKRAANTEMSRSNVPATSTLPLSSSVAVAASNTQTSDSSTLPSNSHLLLSHRIQTLHASSSKLSTAFTSYGASPSDLYTLDFGYPGIGFSLPEGWAKDWFANREQEKINAAKEQKKGKRRRQKEGNKNQVPEETLDNPRRSNRNRKVKQADTEGDEAQSNGVSLHEQQFLNGDGDGEVLDEEGWEREGRTLSKRGKRKRSEEDEEGSDGRHGSKPSKKKRKPVRGRSQTPSRKKFKSAESIVDCD